MSKALARCRVCKKVIAVEVEEGLDQSVLYLPRHPFKEGFTCAGVLGVVLARESKSSEEDVR